MDTTHFKQWLNEYGQAWQDRSAEAVTRLFTPWALYYWTPFDQPKRGHEGIARAWQEATSRQERVKFRYEILAITGNRGLARWWCNMVKTPDRKHVNLEGIFMVTLNPDNLCEEFREWWHSHER